MNSSGRKRDRALAERRNAKKLLEGLANLPDGEPGFKWFDATFPYVMKEVKTLVEPLLRDLAIDNEQEDFDWKRSGEQLVREYWLPRLRQALRGVWRAKNSRTKTWGMFRISQDFFLQGEYNLIKMPTNSFSDLFLKLRPPTKTERLLMEFLRLGERACYCANPDCKNPYFIAERCTAKYCSEQCALPSQREFKRKWWAEHGTHRRTTLKLKPKKIGNQSRPFSR